MSTYGRKVMDLESNLKKLQLNLRKDIENTKDENARYLHEVDKRYLRILEILHTKSMGLIQRVYRGFAARRVMSYYYLGRTTRVWDVESGRGTLDLIFIAYFSVFYGYIYMYTSGGIFFEWLSVCFFVLFLYFHVFIVMDTFACSCYSCILTMFILMSKFQQSYACQTLLYHPSSHTDDIILCIPLSPPISHCILYITPSSQIIITIRSPGRLRGNRPVCC